MVQHLDHEWELEHPNRSFIVNHLYQTIEVLGGIKGVTGIAVAIILFYAYVVYAITSGRKKREAAKLQKQK